MTTKSFRDLIVWQKSLQLSFLVYEISRAFDESERYGLMSQIRRCSVSIPSNIAEGSRRGSKKEFLQFLRIADGSAAELETQLLIAQELYPTVDYSRANTLLEEVQKMLAVFIKKMK